MKYFFPTLWSKITQIYSTNLSALQLLTKHFKIKVTFTVLAL